MQSSTTHQPRERRYHTVFVTTNTEYHVRRGNVVAVRPRGSNEWLSNHKALSMKVGGHVQPGAAMPLPGPPEPGDRLFLEKQDKSVLTSTVVAVERPQKDVVAEYPPEKQAT